MSPRSSSRRVPERRERTPSGDATPTSEPAAIAVADTHSLLWAGDRAKRRKLGRAARAHFDRVDQRQAALYVPTIVLVEVGELQQLGRIKLGSTFDRWLTGLVESKVYIPIDLSADIVRAAHRLYDIPERGDRLIAATAVVMEVPLISRDSAIAKSARVEHVWE